MIIHSVCNSCLQPFTIIVESRDVHLIRQISEEEGQLCPCPKLCGGKINLVGQPALDVVRDRLKQHIQLTGTELYKAVMGAGLPEEIPRSPEVVEAMLLAHKVVKVNVSQEGITVFLNEIHLENGVVLHLTAGLRGAHVLKITKEKR